MPFAYYGNRIPNQMASIITRPSSGLNEYESSLAIGENFLSDCIDVSTYRNDGIEFDILSSTVGEFLKDYIAANGVVRQVIILPDSNEDATRLYAFVSNSTQWKIIYLYYNDTAPANAIYTVNGAAPASPLLYDYSSCVFSTEAETFYCFTCSYAKQLNFVSSRTGVPYGYVTLPFYPKKMVTHASRIFIIDTANKLWWCRAGDLYSWYAQDYDDDAIFASTNMKGTAYTITSQPDTARPITITHTVTDTADTVGTLALVGELAGVVQSETITPTAATGRVQSFKQYDVITSLTPSGWSQGGATPDTIMMGWGPIGGFVQEDAGYATIERETRLLNLCVINNAIYIFAENSIYIFHGFSYDTFSLQSAFTGVGLQSLVQPNGYDTLAVVRDNAYMIFRNEIYEFDGNRFPKIISRPVIVNDSVVNGVSGGIILTGADWVLSSDSFGLYVYLKSIGPSYFYYFDYETRSWWKRSGITTASVSGETDTVNVRLAVEPTGRLTYAFVSLNSATGEFFYTLSLSCKQSADPFLVTKAYNTVPSETGTLTEVLLMLGSTSGNKADIELLYSLTEDSDDFVQIKKYTQYTFTADTVVLSIPVPVAYIASAHHYRLKVIIGTMTAYPVILYNIERRFRVKGRSR